MAGVLSSLTPSCWEGWAVGGQAGEEGKRTLWKDEAVRVGE